MRIPQIVIDTNVIVQFVALAVAEKIAALTTEGYLQERASRGDRTKYKAVLAKVADIDPVPYDALPSAPA